MCVQVYSVISGGDIDYGYLCVIIPDNFVDLKALQILSTTFAHMDLSKTKTHK